MSKLTKKQQEKIGGGRSWICIYENPDGTLHRIPEDSDSSAIAQCGHVSNCRGCEPEFDFELLKPIDTIGTGG
ncbi:MAG: hypothetical protein AAFQ94_25905 [Bacteroidota bacterium]